MCDPQNLLMLEFLTWVSSRPRTYDEAMEAWQSHCPRQTVWEDAIVEGYVELNQARNPGAAEVALTRRGRALLDGQSQS